MLTDQYLVTVRVDIDRREEEERLSNDEFHKIMESGIKVSVKNVDLNAEVIEANYIGHITDSGEYIED